MIAARVAGVPMPGLLHRLAQLVVVDELAGGLHRAQQRRVGVAPRRLGLLLVGGDLARVDLLALLELGQLLVAALVLLGGGLLVLGHLAVDAAPARDEQHLAARAEHVGLDRGLHARVLELGLRVEDREEAPGDHVVDLAVVLAHLRERMLGLGRDDRVVVADLGVVDDAAERQQVEPCHVRRGLGVGVVVADALGGRLDVRDHVATSGSASSCADR